MKLYEDAMPAREADHGIYATLHISRRGYRKDLSAMANRNTILQAGRQDSFALFGKAFCALIVSAPFLPLMSWITKTE
jgi:hypothetical protein